MIKAGIIDPTKVVVQALKNAVSVSIAIMTTDVVVVPLPEENKPYNKQNV